MRKSYCEYLVAVAGILLLACASCKPREVSGPPAPATATSVSASTLPTTAPVSAVFYIGGREVSFLSPAISLDKSSTPMQLILYSDDAPAGNFYFEIPVEGEWAVDSSVSWEEQLHPNADDESMVGIHLPGRTLLPESLRITVRQLSPNVAHVELTGDFAVHIDDAAMLGSAAKVSAEFFAAVEQ